MKISSLKKNGEVIEYDVILTYHSDKFNKDYMIYTENEYNEKHELILYMSEYNKDDFEYTVKEINDKEEYTEVKREIDKILLKLKEEQEKL